MTDRRVSGQEGREQRGKGRDQKSEVRGQGGREIGD